MPLIIYAFYGLGKTTLANKYPNIYYDDDWAVPNKPAYSHQPIILTNNHNRTDIDIYFLPKNFEAHCLKLNEKLNFFEQYNDDFIKNVYNEVKTLKPVFCDYLTHDISNQLEITHSNKDIYNHLEIISFNENIHKALTKHRSKNEIKIIDPIEIGKRIKHLRKEFKMSKPMLAEFLSVSETEITNIENGKQMLQSHEIEKLASLFLCKTDTILYGDHSQKISINDINLTTNDVNALVTVNKIALNQFEMDDLLIDSNNL